VNSFNFSDDFGDCEVQAIEFRFEKLGVTLFNPESKISFQLLLSNAKYCLFESDHLQNVIEGVNLFISIDDALKDERFKKFMSKSNFLSILDAETKELEVLYVSPITGGELAVIFSGLEISTNSHTNEIENQAVELKAII
jgi:hypothetical protein